MKRGIYSASLIATTSQSLVAFKELADTLYIVAESPPPDDDNPYLEEVVIPTYNPNDTSHVIITTSNGKWSNTVLNDSSKQHFYMEAGEYQDIAITLEADGTNTNRRTLSLYNPSNPTDDTHPAALSDAEQASCRIHISGADYWTIDRISDLDHAKYNTMLINGASKYNIINRWHCRGADYGIRIRNRSDYTTVQNCYIHSATHDGRVGDAIGIDMSGADTQDGYYTIGCKFINNDIRNFTDSIQLSSYNMGHEYPNTVIDGNRLWIDSEIYTDGNGNYTPNGEYAVAEQALDLKAGSDNPETAPLITNNIMWGFRHADTSVMAGTDGYAIIFSYPTSNIKIKDNIIFDSAVGANVLYLSGSGAEISNNIFYDIGVHTPTGKRPYCMLTLLGDGVAVADRGVKYNNNTFIKNDHGRVFDMYGYSEPYYNNNLFIDTIDNDTVAANIDDNWYYNHSEDKLTSSTNVDMTTSDPIMDDYTFKYDRFTANPKTMILPGIITTEASPHYGIAGSDISISSIVEDPIYPPDEYLTYRANVYTTDKGYLVPYTDATGVNVAKGFKVTRVTDAVIFNDSSPHHVYGKWDIWNSTEEYFHIYWDAYVQTSDYALYEEGEHRVPGARWSKISGEDYIHYGGRTDSNGQAEITRFDLMTGTLNIIWTSPEAKYINYEPIFQEGNFSDDGTKIAFLCTYASGTNIDLFIYNAVTNTADLVHTFGQKYGSVDVTPSGNYYICYNTAEWQTELWEYTGGVFQIVRVLNPASVNHSQICVDTDGTECFVQFVNGKGMTRFNFDGTSDIIMTNVAAQASGGHVTFARGRRGWAYVSYEATGYNEVVAIKLDGSQIVNRFCQCHTGGDSIAAAVNYDGTKVMFKSRMENSLSGPHSFICEPN